MTRRIDPVPWVADWRPSSWSPVPPDGLTWARWGSGEPGQGVHGFVDDWRLESLSRGSLGGLGPGRQWMTEPDFSVLAGMPAPVVSYQVYRARFLGDRLRQSTGLPVVPVLQWADPSTFHLSIWGIQSGSALAVRAPGRDLSERNAWVCGYAFAMSALSPSHVLVFGCVSRVRGVLEGVGVPWSSCALRRTRWPVMERRGAVPIGAPGSSGS